MSRASQVVAVTAAALRGLPGRAGASLVVVIGVAAVVAVLVCALAIASSFRAAAAKTGSPLRAIVLNGDDEADSGFSRQNAGAILNAPGVRAGPGMQVVGSAEAIEFVSLVDEHSGLNAYVTLRGVGPQLQRLRPELHMSEGRMFARGAHEVIAGRAAQSRLGGLKVGSTISLPNGPWTVVGTFSSGGDAHESEVLADAETLLNAYHRNDFNSVTVALRDPRDFAAFSAALAANPTLMVKAYREPEYFATMMKPVAQLLIAIAYGIGGIMALGAVFSALNTLYSAVSSRAVEIGTLRAIGFGAAPVVISVLAEALALGAIGAALGAGIAWLLVQGTTMSAMTGVTPSQLTFALSVGPAQMLTGVAVAALIVIIGGLLAALRSARVPVAAALRMS
ncbi:MAG TPA: ABC transporter permease [Steroidobacteraceae bacterium]|nr:ABC transporter permease [Steroidobacteraceae bacterium]